MRIQHNIPALNAHRNLGVNNAATAKNLEKLSSGFRINRAGDDAAGLAISEKMRGQIRGLAMAEQNTSMGINLIQTAEGGLNETHAILQRMRELAVQASNDTFQDSDRTQITHEFEALKSEIDRISESTHYNGIKLLDGSLSGAATGSNAVAPEVKLVTTFDPADFKIQKGDYVAATSAVYTIATAQMGDLTTQLKEAGYDLTKVTTSAQMKTILADFFGVDEADYTWGMQDITAGTPGTTDAAFAADAITMTATTPGKIDPNADKILLAKNRDGNTRGLAFVSKAGVDAYNKVNFVIGGSDDSLINGQFTVNGKTYTFKGDGDKAADGTTNITQSGDKLADGSYVVYIGQIQDPTITDLERADLVADEIIKAIGHAESAVGNDPITGLVSGGTVGTLLPDTIVTTTAGSGVVSIDVALLPKTAAKIETKTGDGLVFQVGANGSDDQRVGLNVDDMGADAIGLQDANGKVTGSVAKSSISTRELANEAINILDNATEMVSAQRAKLGALQNRLEHTMNNLGVTKENLTASESTIRDVDMAKEMMEFTKNNIISQAAQAMLAQANQLPQGVLQLLR